ncbi:MAG TPA: hypothetical protein VFE67_15195 [Rudaea sp.]|jgi:hypothetical protein|nr:hypothetical protein [Rudaea sp.]
MSQYRYILFSLLFVGITCAQAQPIVKINPGASECDVTAHAGDPIFQLDATGNVIVTGDMSGSCGTSSGATQATFGFNPPASGVKINGGSASVAAGSVTSVPFTYQAYNAISCSVGQPTTVGSCPAITATNGGCTGTGAQLGCSPPSSAALSIPTVASMGTNTSCNYTVTANCSGGTGASNFATLTVTAASGGGGGGSFGTQPAACTASPVNPIGLTWQRSAMWTWQAGQPKTNVTDATDYRNIWSGPVGTGQLPWPGASPGIKPVVDIAANQYLAMGFVVPAGLSIAPLYFNVGSASPLVAMTISECPGDFGQAGTHITSQWCKSDRNDGGVQTLLTAGTGPQCHLTPGKTYYLNLIDSTLPAANGTTAPASACISGTCSAQVEMTY